MFIPGDLPIFIALLFLDPASLYPSTGRNIWAVSRGALLALLNRAQIRFLVACWWPLGEPYGDSSEVAAGDANSGLPARDDKRAIIRGRAQQGSFRVDAQLALLIALLALIRHLHLASWTVHSSLPFSHPLQAHSYFEPPFLTFLTRLLTFPFLMHLDSLLMYALILVCTWKFKAFS